MHLIKGQPLHIEKPSESVFRIFMEKDFLNFPSEYVQALIRSYNIVLTDCKLKEIKFNAQGLGTLKRIGAIIKVQGKCIF